MKKQTQRGEGTWPKVTHESQWQKTGAQSTTPRVFQLYFLWVTSLPESRYLLPAVRHTLGRMNRPSIWVLCFHHMFTLISSVEHHTAISPRQSRDDYPHFIEAQRDGLTCPRSHRKEIDLYLGFLISTMLHYFSRREESALQPSAFLLGNVRRSKLLIASIQ